MFDVIIYTMVYEPVKFFSITLISAVVYFGLLALLEWQINKHV